jgi:hypothetical protein
MPNLKLGGITALSESSGVVSLDSAVKLSAISLVPGTAPSSPSEGQIYYNDVDNAAYIYNGSAWQQMNNDFSAIAENTLPSVDNTYDLGSSTKRWQNIYTTDLHLENERGNWTVIEEEDYLTLRNNKNDKVYKLVMEEIV